MESIMDMPPTISELSLSCQRFVRLFSPVFNWHIPHKFMFVPPSRLHRMLLDRNSTVLSLRFCRFHLVGICGGETTTVTAADVGNCVSRGPLLPPTMSLSAAAACLRRCTHGRRRRQRNPTPAADSDVGGTTLQPASAGIWACPVRRMPNRTATFWAEHLLQSKTHLQSKICVPLHFNPNSVADRIGQFQIA
jgi:hypothetical protein